MGNCIPATKVTANCDGNIIKKGSGLYETTGKRCPWICDPTKMNDGDGITTCKYDYHCKNCTPINFIDNTNCGEIVECPNPGAKDGCGVYKPIIKYLDKDIKYSGSRLQQDIEIITDSIDYNKKYNKYNRENYRIDNINNYYNLEEPEKKPIYKSPFSYGPFNSIYNFLR